MSQNGHVSPFDQRGGLAVVGSFELVDRGGFPVHDHDRHQVAWASSGLLAVHAAGRMWVLPRTDALVIPAGEPHRVIAEGTTTMFSAYVDPARCDREFAEPTVVSATGLLGPLLVHLAGHGLGREARRRAEAVLVDLLEPADPVKLDIAVPADDRAARIAAALRADPGDGRSIEDWGAEVGASGRTLARIIQRETGESFGRWRSRIRVSAAIPMLVAGESVARVARAVGYATPSSFVAAFRRVTGTTPGAYVGGGRGVS